MTPILWRLHCDFWVVFVACLRVPLLCVPFELKIEGIGQVLSSVIQREAIYSAPKIKNISGGPTGWMEALKDSLVQVDGEAAPAFTFGAVNGTRSSQLDSAAS